MVGIYKITNIETGRCYIGQSKDIEKRQYQHWHSPSNSKLDEEIFNNPDNFMFEVLEECPVEKLNEREFYYTKYYSSTEQDIGYNYATGTSRPGVTNSNSKLDMIDVMLIRQAYGNHESKKEVFEKYKHLIGWRGFEKVWFGETWPNVMMNVYTEENKYYYTHDAKSFPQPTRQFTDEEVIGFRKRFVNESSRQIYDSLDPDIKSKTTFGSFECLLNGARYPDLPLYKKKEKKWVNI